MLIEENGVNLHVERLYFLNPEVFNDTWKVLLIMQCWNLK